MGSKHFHLENGVTHPAAEGQLVEALLAFTNGRDVVIRQSDEVRRWSLWREQPTEEERAALVQVLKNALHDPRYALGITSEWARAPVAPIEFGAPLPTSDHALLVFGDLRVWFAHMDKSIEHRFVMVPQRAAGAWALVHYYRYLNVASALTAAALLLIDRTRPYAGALRRCKGCKGFYVARRTREGRLANKLYCSPACREQYHNSAARKG